MKLPYLNEIASSRQFISAFGGYNHNLRIADGEFYDMENLTSDHYPVLSPRDERSSYITSPDEITGLIAKDGIFYTCGEEMIFPDSTSVDMGLSGDPKSLVSMGAYIIIMPDKKYINTTNTSDLGSTNSTLACRNTTCTLCDSEGSAYTVLILSERPSKVNERFIWYDNMSEPRTYRRYYASSASWGEVETYVKIAYVNIGAYFSVGDVVQIESSEIISRERKNSQYQKVVKTDKHYIVVEGFIDPEDFEYETETVTNIQQTLSEVTITRNIPDMDIVTEHGNRLWGCKYGGGINEIYASKLGDFKNWYDFSGLSTDSYTMSVGSDGPFTAATAYGDCVLFFKEKCIHKIYGSYPAEFSSVEIECEGVEIGSEKSIAVVNGVLYYKGRSGIWAYDGSMPTKISDELGNVSYKDAVACACGDKYYIFMKEKYTEICRLFVYDTAKGLWHKEDGCNASQLTSYRNALYFVNEDDNTVYTYGGAGSKNEKVAWYAETGIMGTDDPDNKYITKLNIRASLTEGSEMRFYIDYDSRGEWQLIHTMAGTSLRSFTVPIRLRRCDHFRLRIEGEGAGKILSIAKTIYGGSDTV